MGSHVTRASCSTAVASVTAKGGATRLSTYTGVSLDALVHYERAALHVPHSLDALQQNLEKKGDGPRADAVASMLESESGPTAVSQTPRPPLFHVEICILHTSRKECEDKQHVPLSSCNDGVVMGTSYCDGVPVLLQEMAWEWFSSIRRQHQLSTVAVSRPHAVAPEHMVVWRARASQLLHDYVDSQLYEKALKRARKAAKGGAQARGSTSAVAQRDEICCGGAHHTPQPLIFQALFESYGGLSHSLTTQRRSIGAVAASLPSSDGSNSFVTPSMWCAVLCQFLRALPEPLMPSLCSRRLESLAGKPSGALSAATVPPSSSGAVHAAVRRVIKESFVLTDVVAYTTFCYVLNLVHQHRAELSGDEVEAVAQAIVRESSLVQLIREVAHACKPELQMFFPPRTFVAELSKVASVASIVRKAGPKVVRSGDRLTATGTPPSTPLSTSTRADGCTTPLLKSNSAARAAAAGDIPAGRHRGCMAPPKDERTSISSATDAGSVQEDATRDSNIGEQRESKGVTADVVAEEGPSRSVMTESAAQPPVIFAVKTPPVPTTLSAGGGMKRQPPTSLSSAAASKGDEIGSEHWTHATAVDIISTAAPQAEEIRPTSSRQVQGSRTTATVEESRSQQRSEERFVVSTKTPLMGIDPLRESSELVASDHPCPSSQLEAKQQTTRSEDQDVQPPFQQSSRPELSSLSTSKLEVALYPSALEDPAGVEAEMEALQRALRLLGKSSPVATSDAFSNSSSGSRSHERPPIRGCGAPQGSTMVSTRAHVASRPARLPPSHHVRHTPLAITFPQNRRSYVPKCSSVSAPVSAISVRHCSPSPHLRVPPIPGDTSSAPLPAVVSSSQAAKSLLTALTAAKQRFLTAPTTTTTRRGKAVAVLVPRRAAERVGPAAAPGGSVSEREVDVHSEFLMAYPRNESRSMCESLVEPFKMMTGSWSHASSGMPDAVDSAGGQREFPAKARWFVEERPPLRKYAVIGNGVPGVVGRSDKLSGVDSSLAEHPSHFDREKQRPEVPQRGTSSSGVFSSAPLESTDSVMCVDTTREYHGEVSVRTNPQSNFQSLLVTEEEDNVVDAKHAHVGPPMGHNAGHVESDGTIPPTATTASPANSVVDVPAAQHLKGLEQELKQLRHVVRTLESQQFVKLRQASAQTAELRAQYMELQHQQRTQEQHFRLTRAHMQSLEKELGDLRSVKARLLMQFVVSQQEGARLRDSLLLGVTRT